MAGRVISSGGWVGGIRQAALHNLRQEARLDGENITGQNFDHRTGLATAAVTSQEVLFSLVGLYEGDVITNLLFKEITVGSTVVSTYGAIYNTSGTRLAVTADLTAQFASVGNQVCALTSAYTVQSTGAYYLAFMQNAATGCILLRGVSSSSGIHNAITGGVRHFGSQTGQTSMPATATIANAGSSTIHPWIGWN